MFEFLKRKRARKVYDETEPSKGFCVNCKFSVLENAQLMCDNPRNIISYVDPVSGEGVRHRGLLESCNSQRMGSCGILMSGGLMEYDPKWRCGIHGGWFEPKDL